MAGRWFAVLVFAPAAVLGSGAGEIGGLHKLLAGRRVPVMFRETKTETVDMVDGKR